jgi:hypothetical protein
MSWDFKNNPLLRAILVFVIGIAAFEILFNSFSGGAEFMGDHMDMGTMGSGGGYGYTISGLISGLLFLLVKILMILLVTAVIVGVIIWLKNNFFKNNGTSKIMQSIKNDPILKTISVVTLAIIGIVLVFALLGSFNQTGMGFSGHAGNFDSGYGYNSMYSIAGLLTILVKVLMFILTVSLILAAVTYLKNQYDQGNLNFMNNKPTTGKNTTGTVNFNDTQATDSGFTSQADNTTNSPE